MLCSLKYVSLYQNVLTQRHQCRQTSMVGSHLHCAYTVSASIACPYKENFLWHVHACDDNAHNVQGLSIKDHMRAIPQNCDPAPIIRIYVDLNLQTLHKAGVITGPEPLPVDPQQPAALPSASPGMPSVDRTNASAFQQAETTADRSNSAGLRGFQSADRSSGHLPQQVQQELPVHAPNGYAQGPQGPVGQSVQQDFPARAASGAAEMPPLSPAGSMPSAASQVRLRDTMLHTLLSDRLYHVPSFHLAWNDVCCLQHGALSCKLVLRAAQLMSEYTAASILRKVCLLVLSVAFHCMVRPSRFCYNFKLVLQIYKLFTQQSLVRKGREFKPHFAYIQEIKARLANIFKMIGDKASTEQGLVELWHFQRDHPQTDINPHLARTSAQFRHYIQRGLSKVDRRMSNTEGEKMLIQLQLVHDNMHFCLA